jgi:hypothetical protein
VKWDAKLGEGKGRVAGTRDDQIVLRRESMRRDPGLAADPRPFVVLGVSHAEPDLTTYTTSSPRSALKPVSVRWLTWDDLASCDRHPRGDEFRRYLDWKRHLIHAARR